MRLGFLALLSLAFNAYAIPHLINYQGQLTSLTGTPLDTTVTMTFTLYSTAAGGIPLWTETYSPVIVGDGLFNVQLGSLVPLGDYFIADRWLGITVGGNSEMTPRQPITSVASAYRVGTLDWASGGYITSSVNILGELQVGDANTITSSEGLVVGSDNVVNSFRSSITGGSDNLLTTSAVHSHIGGGTDNDAHGQNSVIGGGQGNFAEGDYSAITGGRFNRTQFNSFVGGGVGNTCLGSVNVISGGDSNVVYAGGHNVIGGGSGNEIDSIAYGTIAGGQINRVAADYGTVSGGFGNSATGYASVVAGGQSNSASGQEAVVSGGDHNAASGYRSFVAAGGNNEAASNYCFAGGNNSHALHSGAFVWGDGWGTNLTSSANDQFSVRASGGYRLFSNNNHLAGVTMAAGGNAWIAVSDSTKKRNIRLSDTKAVLTKISELPIKEWEYKSEAEGTEHIGPMAQDFWNAFGLGSDSLGIETIDADGVLFAAVQELASQNARLIEQRRIQDEHLANLDRRIQQLEAVILQFGALNNSVKQ